MAPTFPLRREALPQLRVSRRQQDAAKSMMQTMLEHTVDQFDKHLYDDGGAVDTAMWKSVAVHDDLRVFRERIEGETSRTLAQAIQGSVGDNSGLSQGATMAALTSPSMLMTGYAQGKVENAMYAVVTTSQAEMALVSTYMFDDVADCAILKMLEGPDEQNPSRFLGYKYLVKTSTASRVLKHRDHCYLEYCGYTQTRTGETLGFHLMHSVDLPEYPDLSPYNSIRALQSVRYLYRQKSEKVVEVFMLGNMDLSGMLMKPVASIMTAGALFNVVRLLSCAEAKRMTHMVRRRRDSVELLQSHRRTNECYLCRRSKRFFGGALLTECDVCRQFVCSKCRNDKKVFVLNSDDILGRFEKVQTCKTCVLVASAGYTPAPMHMLVSQQMKAMRDRTMSRDRSVSHSSGSRTSVGPSESSSSTSTSEEDVRIMKVRIPLQTHSESGDSVRSSTTMRRSVDSPLVMKELTSSLSANRQSAVSRGHTVPLQAPVSIGKARARQQSGGRATFHHQRDQRQLLNASAVARLATERAELMQAAGASDPDQFGWPDQVERALVLHHGNCKPPRQDRNLLEYDPPVLRRTASAQAVAGRRSECPTPPTSSASFSGTRASTAGLDSRQTALYARMVELSKVAESTHNTIQQNRAYLAQRSPPPRYGWT